MSNGDWHPAMAMEAVAMMIRTGSLGQVEYVYSDLSRYTLQDAEYDEDFDFGYEWWRLHQQPVGYVYSDTSRYTLQNAGYDQDFDFGYEWWRLHRQPAAYAYSDLSRYTLPRTGPQATAGAQPPVQQQSSPGRMLLLAGAVGLALFLTSD